MHRAYLVDHWHQPDRPAPQHAARTDGLLFMTWILIKTLGVVSKIRCHLKPNIDNNYFTSLNVKINRLI